MRREGYSVEAAQDLTQEFFARFLEKQYLRAASRNRGNFRSFLLTALKHFLTQEWRKGRTAKRGGGQPLIAWDEFSVEQRYSQDDSLEASPVNLYDRQWALTILERALDRLYRDFHEGGKTPQFELFKQFLSAEGNEATYAAIAGELDMSPGAVAVAVHRFRQRYGELVREEVAHTVARLEDVEEEMRYLIALVST